MRPPVFQHKQLTLNPCSERRLWFFCFGNEKEKLLQTKRKEEETTSWNQPPCATSANVISTPFEEPKVSSLRQGGDGEKGQLSPTL